MKHSRNGKITLPFTDVDKSYILQFQFFYLANMSFNAIRDNKILARISEFIVIDVLISGRQLRLSAGICCSHDAALYEK